MNIQFFRNLVLIFALSITQLHAQTGNGKSNLVLIEIDSRQLYNLSKADMNPQAITDMTRLELDKLQIYNVINKYDLDYLLKRDSIETGNCFSTYCISDVARKLSCDKVFTGSIGLMADKIVIIFKVYDLQSGQYDKQIVKEYLNLPLQLPAMIKAALREMYGLPNNNDELRSMVDKFEFDDTRNNPYKSRLRTDGPRMGLTYFTGTTATLLAAGRESGGFNAQPLMFQFGYQFEKQYLNEGNFQALFEFVPTITGLDQGLFIPSLTLMNGIRNNKTGWEFAFGPSVSLVSKANGFYDVNQQWHLAADSVGMLKKPFIQSRLDSRGELALQPSFIFAVGKTFKSGKLNMPVNLYFIPHHEGFRFGLSFGFNSKVRYESPDRRN